MCPFILLSLLLGWILAFGEVAAGLTVRFSPNPLRMKEEDQKSVSFNLVDHKASGDRLMTYDAIIRKTDNNIVDVVNVTSFSMTADQLGHGYNNSLLVKGLFLGETEIYFERHDVPSYSKSKQDEEKENSLRVIVERKKSLVSRIFLVSVIVLVSFNYVNMGCALDLSVVKSVLRKPVAPLVGFLSQYGFMPVVSFAAINACYQIVIVY